MLSYGTQDLFYKHFFFRINTFKWFLPSVYSLMTFKIFLWAKHLSHWSHLNGFSPLCSLMSYINDYLSITFITLITFKWSLRIVYSLVAYNNSSISKSFMTLVTFKWFLPSECFLITYKMIILCITFITLFLMIYNDFFSGKKYQTNLL